MIEIKNVSFSYNESEYGVNGINLSVSNGECVVLTGESGCGKTTITRLINGLAPTHYSGEMTGFVYIDKKNINELSLYEIGKIVGSIFQDPRRQFFSSELAGEVAFASENYGFSHKEIVSRTDAAINKMQLEHLRNIPVDVISSGEKQRTAVASVYALHPRVFVFDEPTANLDLKGIAELKNVLSELKLSGCTLIIAEHRLDWLEDIADRYIYMSGGEIKKEYLKTEFLKMDEKDRAELGLRRKAKDFTILPLPEPGVSSAITVKGISCIRQRKKIFENLSFFINKGCITALTGHNGIGKTTLALMLSGLMRIKGEIYIDDKKYTRRGLNREVYYCSNDTGTQFFTNSVAEELLLNMEKSLENINEAAALLKRMQLYEYKDTHPQSLSGGQRQRLAVCCALLCAKKILIFDEPTSGLDGRNMLLIAKELKNAVNKGKTVLVITHDEELIAECCDYRLNLNEL